MTGLDGPSKEPPVSDEQSALFDLEAIERQIYHDLCLHRLQELVALRTTTVTEQGPDADLHRRLVDHALYSVYRDAQGAGAGKEARELIGQHPSVAGAILDE